MKKRIAVFVAAGMLLTATSCSKAPVESQKETQPETTVTSTTQSEESAYVPDTEKQYSSDVDAQIEIIANSYGFIKSDYSAYLEAYSLPSFAVADLNHNGRLEVIVSAITTSGALSNTFSYEISEDYSTLERLRVDGEDKPDEAGDFLMSKNNEDHTSLYACYMKDGEYYYLLEDVYNGGWSYKFIMYYAYSFNNGVNRNFVGGCEFSAEQVDDKTVVNTWLRAPNVLFDSDESYLEHLNTFWDDYEKQSSCEIKWMELSDDTDFAAAVAESYDGFNPNSRHQATITYDYHYFTDRIWAVDGTECEYVLQDS